MLDQLVESRNTSAENTRRSEFLLGTLAVMVTILVGAWVYSLFNKAYDMGNLDIGEQVSRVALPEDEPPPPPPEPEKQPEQKSTANPDKPTVIEKIATMDETREPPKDPVGEKLKSPPLTKKDAVNYNEGAENKGRFVEGQTYNEKPTGLNVGGTGGGGTGEGDAPEIQIKTPTPTPKPTEKPVPKTISGGVVNGKAVNLVKPPYPAAARAVQASGAVNVQVTIDERGNVISASAVSGHPLLRASAVQAARASKFSPTQLSGQPVKVTGVIVYNFVP